MGAGPSVHDPGPDASTPPATETVVAGGVRTKAIRQVSPWDTIWGPGAQHPEDAVDDAAVVHAWHPPWRVRQHRPDGCPFRVGEFGAHDSPPRVTGLNHETAVSTRHGQERGGRHGPESGPIALTLSLVAVVKVFGCRPHADAAAGSGGRRTKTSKGGNRGTSGEVERQLLWGFRRWRCGAGVR
jgi:hypothetical protein